MFAKQMEKFADAMIENKISTKDDKDIIVYGLSIGIELFLNIITTVALGIFFGLVWESMIFLVAFSFIRTYAGGYHCKKELHCYFMSSGIIALVLALIKFTNKDFMLAAGVILLIISIPILIKFAPVEVPSKLLDHDEKEFYRKKMISHLRGECVVISILVLSGLHKFIFVICLGIMASVLLVLIQIIVGRK